MQKNRGAFFLWPMMTVLAVLVAGDTCGNGYQDAVSQALDITGGATDILGDDYSFFNRAAKASVLTQREQHQMALVARAVDSLNRAFERVKEAADNYQQCVGPQACARAERQLEEAVKSGWCEIIIRCHGIRDLATNLRTRAVNEAHDTRRQFLNYAARHLDDFVVSVQDWDSQIGTVLDHLVAMRNRRAAALLRRMALLERIAASPQIAKRAEQECSICLEPLERNIEVLPCGHVFHTGCVREWMAQEHFRQLPTCPICRRPIGLLPLIR